MYKDLDDMIEKRILIIGDDIVAPASKLLRYCLCSSFHLNHLSMGSNQNMQESNNGPRKRKRIVERMSEGLNPGKNGALLSVK